jgi:hypothetical protein
MKLQSVPWLELHHTTVACASQDTNKLLTNVPSLSASRACLNDEINTSLCILPYIKYVYKSGGFGERFYLYINGISIINQINFDRCARVQTHGGEERVLYNFA